MTAEFRELDSYLGAVYEITYFGLDAPDLHVSKAAIAFEFSKCIGETFYLLS